MTNLDKRGIPQKPRFRQLVLDAVSTRPVVAALELITGPLVSALMLHRFADANAGNDGADARQIAEMLRTLRRGGVTFVSLAEILDAVANGDRLPSRAVIITVDDGYRDILTIGAPVMLDAGVPFTLFVTTAFVDQAQWMWWDRVHAMIVGAPAREVVLESHGFHIAAHWTRETAAAEARRIILSMEFLPGPVRLGLIAHLASILGERLDTRPDAAYAAITWDEVRQLASAGVEIAPHTVTHPVLSRVSDAQAQDEIATSWRRVQDEVPGATPIFCYPNGTAAAWGPREVRYVREAGMTAAVSAETGYLNRAYASRGAYAVPRFPCDGDAADVMQLVSGLWKLRFPHEAGR
jgi:peptidoglycan/xylan/chitin deacetylase (PgdA/CDA1 family)